MSLRVNDPLRQENVPVRALAMLALANAGLLGLAGIGLWEHLLFVGYTLALAWAGCRWLSFLSVSLSDPLLFAITGYFTAASFAALAAYVALHRILYETAGLSGPWLLISLFTAAGFLLTWAIPGKRPAIARGSSVDWRAAQGALVVSLCVSALTYYYYAHNRLPDEYHNLHRLLGQTKISLGNFPDKPTHLIRDTDLMMRQGMPMRTVNPSHQGTQSLVLSYLQAVAFWHPKPLTAAVQIGSQLALLLYFSLAYASAAACRDFFGLGPLWQTLSMLIAFLLAPIPLPLPPNGPFLTSYVGGLNGSGSLHYNATQLFCVGFAAPAFYLLVQQFRERVDRRFVVACLLIAASLFFKPSLFMDCAPALFLMALWSRRGERKPMAAGLTLLLVTAAAWFLVPIALAALPKTLPTRFEPFEVLLRMNRGRYWGWLRSDLAVIVATFAMGLGAFLIAWPEILLRKLARRERPLDFLKERHFVFYLVCNLGAMAVWLSFIEDTSFWHHDNFTWGRQAVLVLSVPALVYSLSLVRSALVRLASFALLAGHLLGGLHFLYRLVRFGTL
jgi:hypothetical protein